MPMLDFDTTPVVTVDEVSQYIKDLFDADPLLGDVWVRGEISNARRSPPGHWYFVLKSESSQLRAALFRNTAALVAHKPRDGDAVIAKGRISTYPTYGQYQLYVEQIIPEGAGLLNLQFEELRRKLEGEGLFDPSRKRALPPYPRYIGVVTSPTGSVWHDIQDVLKRRYPLGELILSPALVQGQAAPASIIEALNRLINDGRSEVIIVARGGGSIEDLWSFNDERVIRALYRCPIPIVSAIGHETDVTLTDLVADQRAPTPSAAAELVAPHIREYQQHLVSARQTLVSAITQHIHRHRQQLGDISSLLARHDPHWTLQQERMRLDRLGDTLHRSIDIRQQSDRARIDALARQLTLLDPSQLLQRGYAMVTDDAGNRVRGVRDIQAEARIRLDFQDGHALARVEQTEARNGDPADE